MEGRERKLLCELVGIIDTRQPAPLTKFEDELGAVLSALCLKHTENTFMEEWRKIVHMANEALTPK